MMKKILFIIPLVLIMTCCDKVYRYTSDDFYSMSTFMTVISENENDADTVEYYTKDFEKRLSRTDGNSEIYALNENTSADLSEDTLEILTRSLEIAENTDFAFNPCMGALSELWNITANENFVPSDEDIKNALESCKEENLSIEKNNVTVKNGMKVDLGGVAKGYALQKALEMAEGDNVCINFGGNVAVKGSSEYNKNNGNKGWKVAITNPFDKDKDIGILVLEHGFVSASGAYERNFEKDGKTYHHIFDSKTGYPAESDLALAAVVGTDGLEADALSTALFVMGKEKAIDFYKKGLYQFDIILVTNDGSIYISKELNKTFTIGNNAFDNKGEKMTIIEIEE